MGKRLEREAADKRGVRWKLIGDRDGEFSVCPPTGSGQRLNLRQRLERRVANARIHPFTDGRGKILDIKVDRGPENQGIGSLLLQFMELWAKLNGITFPFGDLSWADADHFDKLRHFYEKQGYKFDLDPHAHRAYYKVGEVSKRLL